MDRIVLDEENLPLQQLFIIAQAAAPSSGDKLQREKGRPGNGDILCDVPKEKAGDGACQLGNTNDSPYPDLCQKKKKCTLCLELLGQSKMFSGTI